MELLQQCMGTVCFWFGHPIESNTQKGINVFGPIASGEPLVRDRLSFSFSFSLSLSLSLSLSVSFALFSWKTMRLDFLIFACNLVLGSVT